MTTYLDPTTELPQNLGEIYSDRNIRIIGQVRINPSSPTQIDTIGLQIICSPSAGGSEGISIVADGTQTLGGVGTSMWLKLTRSGTVTVTPEIWPSGSQPKPRRDYVQVFYMQAAGSVVALGDYIIEGTSYTRLGIGIGQRVYDAIVGITGDPAMTHTDLQSAINDVATLSPSSGGWILIKKVCLVTAPITVPSGKPIKLYFQGVGTGLQASGSVTGIILNNPGCQLVGLGLVTGFTTYGIDLNNQANCRIEMIFSGNTTAINYGTLNGSQFNVEGSIGLSENAHVQTSTTNGTVLRWNSTLLRYDPVTAATIDASGNFITTGTINSGTITTPALLCPQIGAASGTLMLNVNGYSRIYSPTQSRLAAGTGSLDYSLQHIYYKTGGTATITLSNLVEGQTANLVLTSTGSAYTITWLSSPSATLVWGPTGTPIPTVTASKYDFYTFIKVGGLIFGMAILAMA